ncbi:MAG: YciI family protein [Saprospiraceae bacterium]|nr:YciI family protein [Saprospiraceae bacterium]
MMRTICLLTLLLVYSCKRTEIEPAVASPDFYATLMDTTATYDSTLARQFGADALGMKTYVMAFLKRGPNRSQDSVEAARLQRAHLDNITRMANMGKLLVAGPFLDDDDVRGIYVFDVATVEEARALTETDPAIQSGRLVMELHPWYGPAALKCLSPLHKRIERK